MRFLPHNRNISVEPVKNEKPDDTAILLPSDYRPEVEPYAIVRVTADGAAPDCQRHWEPGWLLVVEAHMIREIIYGEDVYYTITENYVVGSLSAYERA